MAGIPSRFPRGKRGLKSAVGAGTEEIKKGRFPRGKRGLKLQELQLLSFVVESLPPREAWIEIIVHSVVRLCSGCRFPRGRRGLKFVCVKVCFFLIASLPSREAWIEISVNAPSIAALGRFPCGKRGLK